MSDLKKLVLLHSNDMHGDFLSKDKDTKLIGGVSMLSGYVTKVRAEEENVLYTIAGDMLQGSLIDTEYKGISTMEIMNYISPDVVCVGNHEVDYGLPHLLFLEKYARFPIISANLYIKNQHTRLMSPHKIITADGIRILFIGILTESVLDAIRTDQYIGTFVDVRDASAEVGKICNSYRTTDIDLTVLLTHIGFENDCKLAELLDPEWGVDIIIGGHSHTILSKPEEVNGILITQAGTGTTQIGRFDLVVNKDTNSVESYEWQLVPIDESNCPRDEVLEKIIDRYTGQLDVKYGRLLTHFTRKLIHPVRTQETELGDLFADAGAEMLAVDLMFLGSGSIRKTELGPNVTAGDFYAVFPYKEPVYQVKMTGAQIRRAFEKILQTANLTNSSEHYQVNRGTQITFDNTAEKIVSLTLSGEKADDQRVYKTALVDYHFKNMEKFLGITPEEAAANGKVTVLATSMADVLEEYLMTHNNLNSRVEGRIVRVN